MKSNEMKVYCNERLGFEINVPSEWPLPSRATDGLMFNLGYNECFYIQVLELVRQPNPKQAEMLFIQLAHDLGYTDLEYGRISVRDKQCVCATYSTGYGFWAKKYIISIYLIEYVLTAGFPSRQALLEKEHSFDEIVKSFRLTESGEQCLRKMEAKTEALFGPLYEKAYQAVSEERFSDARVILEQCINENPDHVFARKELAVVLRHLGDIEGAIQHRRDVKRLDPSDGVNRFNLAGLLNITGKKQESLHETEELLAMEPSNPILQAHRSRLIDNRLLLSYPQHYDEESLLQTGKKCNIKLVISEVLESEMMNFLGLVYQWNEELSEEEANKLSLRAIAYVACAIYDAATAAGLFCTPFEIPNGRRPSWAIKGERLPLSLALSDIHFVDKTIEMSIGAPAIIFKQPPIDRSLLEKLQTGFKEKFNNITV